MLWTGAGLERLETREITVQRTFTDFDDFWGAAMLGASIKATVATMTPEQLEHLKESVRTRLGAADHKPVTVSARANAIFGHVPD